VGIGNGIVVTLGGIASGNSIVNNADNAVRIQSKFVIDDGVEGDNVAFL